MCCPTGDGSASVVLAPRERAREFTQKPVHIRAAAIATDAIALHDRKRLLQLAAAQISARKAYQLALDGKLPIQTMGGLKARGHPVGTTGLYQIVGLTQQLRGEARKNQVNDARLGMAQSVGGSGATIVTHILEADS